MNLINCKKNNIKFTIEKESKMSIIFLYIGIRTGNDNFQFSIYRKKTATDITIPSDSCHPQEHKIAGIKYLLNQIYNYSITKITKYRDLTTINNILQHNNYNINIIARLSKKMEN
jgi:hypothetical protein